MKKIRKIFIFLFFILFLFNANLFAQNYEVKGAGTTDVNGIYVPDGKDKGKIKYVKGEYTLFYKGCHAKWMIKSPNGNFYRNRKDTKKPPETGWEKGCGKGSLNPAPTVVAVSEN
ncbi:MAG: hypothetical protein IMY72_09305 [Bacteroidetes bacterium]|nr:hypothetical protein [Bacteroidota bacterium]